MRRTLALTVSLLAVTLGLAACSSPSSAGSGSVTVSSDAIILDVRTAQEHASGHLDGARLIDFNAGEVAAAIPSLDPTAEYFVYCRSGNRSGQAVALMEKAGFTNVTNLGSLEQAAAATGISVVR